LIILAPPYVSEFLQQSMADLQIPVLATDFAKRLSLARHMNLLDEDTFFSQLKSGPHPLLYSNSENATEILNRHCPDLSITQNVNFFKDKAKLREIFSTLNPDVWYQTYPFGELDHLDITSLPLPLVIKPRRGFASIGIHAIHHKDEWQAALESIKKEVVLMHNVFPEEVVSLDEFLLETYIEGTEIAIDAYYNEAGEPVILNILTHLFGSKSDMSDRLYMTSAEIIRKYHDTIILYLEEIARIHPLRNFPFHLEMRQEENGSFVPMEINPMRFMGFCVADVEYYFYGINPYEYFFHQKKPDWDKILEIRNDKIYGMFGIDIPKHLDKNKIHFDYEKFIGHFSNPIHYTKMDYRKFPMAIYLFAETTKDNFREFEEILFSDLGEFIVEN
jgi:hypothetical protein